MRHDHPAGGQFRRVLGQTPRECRQSLLQLIARAHLGQQDVAHVIAVMSQLGIGRITVPLEPVTARVGLDLDPGNCQQRSPQGAAGKRSRRRHGQLRRAPSAQHAQQDVLDLIVRVMGQQQCAALGKGCPETAIARPSGTLFQAIARGHRHASHPHRQAGRQRRPAYTFGPARRIGMQAVVDVQHPRGNPQFACTARSRTIESQPPLTASHHGGWLSRPSVRSAASTPSAAFMSRPRDAACPRSASMQRRAPVVQVHAIAAERAAQCVQQFVTRAHLPLLAQHQPGAGVLGCVVHRYATAGAPMTGKDG